MIDRLYKLEKNIKELEKFRINYIVDDLIIYKLNGFFDMVYLNQ